MKKLEAGDYVKNLTEKQWNKLLDIENSSYRISHMPQRKDETFYHRTSIRFDEFKGLNHGSVENCKIELTYRQFLSRAKNTFQQ